MLQYKRRFYESIAQGSLRSAEVVVPIILELVRPRSVVDVGCGTGGWLSVFRRNGIDDYLGIDGDYVSVELLQIPAERFLKKDLTRPTPLDRSFDLVVSLEVAEHLPTGCAAEFVGFLTSLGPIVLFSAAVPNQGGTNHLNEQWPEYWARLFSDRGYIAVDGLRNRIWDDDRVEWWYTQNTLLYVKREVLTANSPLHECHERRRNVPLSIVHPRGFLAANANLQRLGFLRVAAALPGLFAAVMTKRLRRVWRES